MQVKHAADSLFLASSERSPLIERAVLLRGVKRKKEGFGFRGPTGEKSSQFSRCEDRHRSESKEAVGERCPAEPVVRANAITLPFSVCAHRSSRGSLLTLGQT
jgi:hypothetical protein